jgi:16S rRNA (guanine527-N7)-methyltransferase
MSEQAEIIGRKLNQLLACAGLAPVDAKTVLRFADYLALLRRWNARTNLTAIRDEDGILSRHFVECIACAQALPPDIATLLDFGSGAGFPGIPIALCRPEIAVTLAESQGKKAAFLREAIRTLGLSASVHSDRAELLTPRFDCVTLRAVDRMPEAIRAAAGLAQPGGWLAVMTTETESTSLYGELGGLVHWSEGIAFAGGNQRILMLGRLHSPV